MAVLESTFRWLPPKSDPAAVRRLAGEMRLHESVASTLFQRGVNSRAEAERFLYPTENCIHDPMLLPDMGAAVERALSAIRNDEKILVFGDYDVDGVSSTALLVSFLRSVDAQVNYYIPERLSEGYGLNAIAIENAARAGYRLIISVDSGTSAVESAALMRERGVDFIALDHHEPPERLPDACAIVNPKREGSNHPFQELCAAGVTFKFVLALGERLGRNRSGLIEEYVEFVALATVADVVPLIDENRFFVAQGLAQLTASRHPGLYALVEASGLGGRDRLTSHHIGFMLAPRINVAGRMWKARRAVNLLLSSDREESERLAAILDNRNLLRRGRQADIFESAVKMLDDESRREDKVIALHHPDWHVGIVGIVASKILERTNKPAILMGRSQIESDLQYARETGRHVALGSARSLDGFDIHEALTSCSDLLLSFGGHKMAAGLRIDEERIGELRQALNRYAAEARPREAKRPLRLDSELKIGDVSVDLLDQLTALEPCGFGNRRPAFVAKDVNVLEARKLGKEKNHLSLKLSQGSRSADCIGFDLAGAWQANLEGHRVDIAFHVMEDNYWGGRKAKIQLLDLRNAVQPNGG